MKLFVLFFAILMGAALFGFLFLWAGITGSLMYEALVHNETIRFFTYLGLGLGGVFGYIAFREDRRKKHGNS